MRYLFATLLCVLASIATAQEDDRGFLGRLFGSDDATTDEDQGTLLERLIEDNLSGDGRQVSVDGFSGALSGRATMDSLTITDADGMWLTITDAVLDWNRAALFVGRLEVMELSAQEILLPRLPAPASDTEAPTPEATGFSLPDLPVSINIDQVSAERILIGRPVAGVEIDAAINGGLRLEDGEGAAQLQIDRRDGAGQIALDTAYANATGVLRLVLDMAEGQDGIIANLIGLPGRPSVDFSVNGEAPVNDFAADIRLATDGAERLSGTVTTAQSDGGALQVLADVGGDIAPIFAPEYRDFFGSNVALRTRVTSEPDGTVRLDDLALTADALRLDGRVEIGPSGLPQDIAITGQIAGEGAPVLLPLAGPETRVDRINLNIAFDADRSEDWTGAFDIQGFDRDGFSADQLTLGGAGRIVDGETQAVTANLSFTANALDLGNADAEQALGESVNGRARINWSSGQALTLRDLTIGGETYSLSGEADVLTTEDGPQVTGAALVRAENLSAFSGIANRALAGRAQLDTRFDLSPLAGTFDVSASGTTDDLVVDQTEADRLLAGNVRLDVSAIRDENGIRAVLRALESPNANLTGQVDLRSGGSTVAINGTVADAALLVPDINGQLEIDLSATEDDNRVWAWDLDAAVPGSAVTATGTALDVYNVPVVALSGRVELGDISDFAALAGRPLSGALSADVTGEVKADASRLTATVNGVVTDVQVGIREADALLEGEVAIAIDAAKAGDVITLRNSRIDGPQAALQADALLLRNTGRFSIEGRIADASRILDGAPATPINLNASGNQTEGDWALVAEADGPGLSASLNGIARDPSGTPVFDGTAAVSVADLGPFSTLAGRKLDGAFAFTSDGSISSNLATLDVEATVTASNLAIGDSRIDPLLRGDLTFRGSAVRNDETIAIDRATLDSQTATVVLQGITVDLGETPSVAGQVQATLPDLGRFANLTGQRLRGSLDLSANGFANASLTDFEIDADVTGRSVAIGQSQVDQLLNGALRAALSATRTDGMIDVRNLDFETALLSATANGNVGEESTLNLQARLANVAPFVDGFSGPVTANGTVGQRSDGSFAVDLDARGPAGSTVTVAGSAASDFGSVNLNIDGSAPLGLANRFISPRSVAGQATIDLSVNGTPDLSNVSGRISSTGARLVAPALGITLNDIDVDTSLSGGRATLNVSAGVDSGGRISVTGPVGLTSPNVADLSIGLDRIILADPRLYETSVDGALTMRGALTGGANISGSLTLGETNVRIPSTGLGGSGEVPEIIHLNEPPPVRGTRRRAGLLETIASESASGGGPAYPIDIRINAPNRIFVRGRGLDSEFAGALRITGTSNNIIPIGGFDLVRGRLDILGQRLVIQEATVTMQGSLEPTLRIVAETQVDEFTIAISVLGTASNPEIVFSSSPELPQEEVLARLLFGRGLDTLSPIQAARLALAVRTLAGRGGEGVLSKVRSGAGLADLDVSTDEAGNAAVTAGAYLGDNLYTDVTVGASGETELNLNLDVSNSVTIKGGFTNEGETSIGIFFERDY